MTELSIPDLTVILHSNRPGFGDSNDKDYNLGTLYELHRIKGISYTISISYPFMTSAMKMLWTNFSEKYIGETQMQDKEISEEGT